MYSENFGFGPGGLIIRVAFSNRMNGLHAFVSRPQVPPQKALGRVGTRRLGLKGCPTLGVPVKGF